MVFLEHGKKIRGVEAVEVVGEDPRLAEPLAVDLAPERLAPARIRHGEMKPLGIHPVPVTGRHDVPHGIGVIVLHHLGVAGGPRTEEDEHGVAYLVIRIPGKFRREFRIEGVEIHPAGLAAVDGKFQLHAGRDLAGLVHLSCDLPVGGGDDELHMSLVEAVLEIVGGELAGGGDRHSTQFVQGVEDVPELIVALEHQHDPVPLAHAHGVEHIGRAGRVFRHLLKGDVFHLLFPGDPLHGDLVRGLFRQTVQNVEGEIEVVRNLEGDAFKRSVLGPLLLHIVLVKKVLLLEKIVLFRNFGHFSEIPGGPLVLFPVHHHGNEGAGAVQSGHGVRETAVEIHGVAFVEDLLPALNGDAQSPVEDVHILLPAVTGEVELLVIAPEGGGHKEGFADAVLHVDGLMQIGVPSSAFQRESLPVSGHGKTGKVGRFPVDDGGNIQTELLGQIVVKGEGCAAGAVFVSTVGLGLHAEQLRHFFQ